MLLRSIRSRLLALVVATVIPFTALIGAGLWRQWQSDQVAAIEHNINEARILAAQIDDHIGNLDNRITQSNEDAAIVGSLIAMAHNLGLCALAKGVQSGEQARFLLREGCAEVQGHLYARSLRAAEFELYLQGRDLARTDEPGRARGMGGNVQKSTGRRKLRRA